MFSILLVLFAIVGLSLLFLLFLLLISSSKNDVFFGDGDQTVEIVRVVEAHRKIIPICPAQGWCLLSSTSGLRCWKKELSFVVMGSPVTVYGCMKQINCSAVIVLNVIADISTWPEWDFWPEGQTVHLEVSEDPSLHGDQYMQCDQIVVTNTAIQTKPDVIMYRFGNLEQNGVGWILLWNAKRLDWTFYVAQPIDSTSCDVDGSGGEKCTLTAISGFDASISDSKSFPDKLCTKVLNLCEAISNSHFKVRPLQPLMKSISSTLNNPHFPTIHSALGDLPKKPCVLLRLQKTRQINILQNCVLAVRPVASEKVGLAFEFQLLSRLQKETMNGTISEGISEEKRRSRRRQKIRCDSMTSGSPVIKVLKNVHLQIEGRRSSSLSAPIVRKKPPELMVTEPDEEPKPATRAVSHSFLDLIFHRRRSSDASDKKSRSPAESRSSTPTRERHRKKKNRSPSVSSQEENFNEFSPPPQPPSSANLVDVRKDSFVDEMLTISENGDSIDFRALGDKCIAALIRENVKVSLIDCNMTEEEQKNVSGGWVCKEMSKDVSVFKKTYLSQKGNIVSYLRKGLIASCYKVVWKTLCDPLTRFMYDNSVKKISVLAELPSGQKFIHMYNESVSLLKKEVQDFCLLQTEKEEENRLILAFHSVEDPSCPLQKDIIRGTVITSGWILERLPEMPHTTRVSYLMQMLVPTPDCQLIEEISSTQCISSLGTYLLAMKPTTLKLNNSYEEVAS